MVQSRTGTVNGRRRLVWKPRQSAAEKMRNAPQVLDIRENA
jgi:hypothetical protein